MNKTTQYILITILSIILVCEIAFVIYQKTNTSTSSKTIQSEQYEGVSSAPSIPSPFSKM